MPGRSTQSLAMFESAQPRIVVMRLLAYVSIGLAVGVLLVYTPAIEFVPSVVVDALGIAYFGSLGLAILVALPVAIVVGIIQSVASRSRATSKSEGG